MIKNFFKIAWRNLFKQPLYAFINIAGLALGICFFILMALYVSNEWSYDSYYENHGAIYRVYQRQHGNEYLGSEYYASMPAPLAKTMIKDFPEVEEAVALEPHSVLMNTNKKNFSEESGLKAEPRFFNIFKNRFLLGNPNSVLENLNSVVLSEKLAKKYFGKTDVLGKTLFLDKKAFQITGIFQDLPSNLSFGYDYVINIANDAQYLEQNWMNNSPYVFVVLPNDKAARSLESKFPAFLEHYQQDDSYPFKNEYFVQPFSELYFSTNINGDVGARGSKTFVGLLLMVAVIILFLACINYINLTVARSIKRLKEVGIRKVIGARKAQIILQFLGESIVFSSISFAIALVASYFLLPFLGELLQTDLEFTTIIKPGYLLGMLLLLLLVALVSGIYPALVVSSFGVNGILKGNPLKIQKGLTVQKALIICQYAACFTLVVGGIIVFQQMQYIKNKDLGYSKDHIVVVPIRESAVLNNLESIKNTLLSNASVVNITASSGLPNNIQSSTIINDEQDVNPEDDLPIYHTRVDYNYLDVFDMELIAGRNFSKDFGTDLDQGYIINEAAAKALGWDPMEAIGKQFDHNGTETVIGVVKDFNLHSLRNAIEPLMISLGSYFNAISIKVHPGQLQNTLPFIQDAFSQYSSYPFEYQNFDDRYAAMYSKELRLGKAVNYFALIAILLASFGLFGLAAIITEQKTKEIGIRRVLGGSIEKIIALLTNGFLRTVLLAFFISIPISLAIMNTWLEGFAFGIRIEWTIYAITGLAAILLTFLTVAYQAAVAARLNPAKALRTE